MLRQSLLRPSQWRVRRAQHFSNVSIGGVTAPQGQVKEAQLVPKGFANRNADGEPHFTQETLEHLRWMLQKDLLGQDMFLIGPPGPARRRLALQFCEIMQREVEYVAISQDTTESDLKQRREILGGSAIFADQAPVRAAIHGRVLILDGLEKAERNVLPTLNNLLENREMALDDGRFLMQASSYDALLAKGYTAAQLEARNLLRVDPAFRVIALGVPVPPYPGRTLDPPLRSRFQARQISPLSPGAQLEICSSIPDGEKLVSLVEAMHVIENNQDGTMDRMPHLNPSVVEYCAKMAETFPNTTDVPALLGRLFPLHLTSWKAHSETFEKVLRTFFPFKAVQAKAAPFVLTRSTTDGAQTTWLQVDKGKVAIASGALPLHEHVAGFVETSAHHRVVLDMLKDHALGSDMCVLGPKGSGKSALARLFCAKLGYSTELFTLFKDMTARDLFQRRATDNDGNTTWEESPLLHAARHGRVAILDGVHRLSSDTLSTLQRFVQDREVDLVDGTKFAASVTDVHRGVVKVHPSFRIVALAEVTAAHPWLTSETLTLFPFHAVPTLTRRDVTKVLADLCPTLPKAIAATLVDFWHEVQLHPDVSLSLRQLLRMARRLDAFPGTASRDLRHLVEDTTMMHFLPNASVMEGLLDKCNIKQAARQDKLEDIQFVDTPDSLTVGNVVYNIVKSDAPRVELIPQPRYFPIPKHAIVMRQMLQDIVSGQPHLLLIGNQGVGKNKVVDRLLQLMHQEREYVQLHRDTTVQTLTLVPSMESGKITWEDSPLVRAVKFGRTLVVDEADKAPLEVVCVLKGLIEDGEMLLGDGRRIVDPTEVPVDSANDNVIVMHPRFRMWVLANRPGYPFLGNNFFSEVGDIFATHVIDNPDPASELTLLQAYAPSVPQDVLKRLCAAFSELRGMVEEGTIAYPYSTREAVAVAKHLEAFPMDGVSQTLENVLAFDAYDPSLRQRLSDVFGRHGVPLVSATTRVLPSIAVAPVSPLPTFSVTETWTLGRCGRHEPVRVDTSTLKSRRIYVEPPTSRTFSVTPCRLSTFSEEMSSWHVPLWAQQSAVAMAVLPDGSIHVLTKQPLGVHSFFGAESSQRLHLYSELEGYGYSKSEAHLMGWSNSLVLHVPAADLLVVMSAKHNVLESRALCRLKPNQDGVFQWKSDTSSIQVLSGLLDDHDLLVRYIPGHNAVQAIEMTSMKAHTMSLPFHVERVHLVSNTTWHVHDTHGNVHMLHIKSPHDADVERIQISSVGKAIPTSKAVHSHSNRFTHPEAYVQVIQADGRSRKSVLTSPRAAKSNVIQSLGWNDKLANVVATDVLLEVVDLNKSVFRHIPKPHDASAVTALAVLPSTENVLSLQRNGQLRVWQVDDAALHADLETWKAMFSYHSMQGVRDMLELKYLPHGTSVPKTDSSLPKHGKEDPDNTPHVGGNTWAGGTGGSDTAGLGGRGGPYRLDKGHRVHQISQEKKDQVTKEAREKAKAMADAALAEQLRRIDMTNHEFATYQTYFDRVGAETSQLRHILKNVEQQSDERGWLKHQSSGEWDDSKLVDGLSGERNVFKKRGKDPFALQIQTQPKKLVFVMDLSGSMYRFNSQDGRLERMLETSLMLMESLAEFETKFDYAIMGHSGDSPAIPFVSFGSPPKTKKDRLKILEKMVAHSQYCSSGDHTVEAIADSIKHAKAAAGDDESFVFVLSDANLNRYGITPQEMSRALMKDSSVSAHAIFIASLADEATRILKHLPQGNGHVCLNTTDLPHVFQRIFKSNVTKE
ncbi:hypothetical protein, variant 1 [Aphanomyces invadans]|uniref:von Willebrand factor A domain-containing protein 8 n=1 Tax=Aphanomyces invadans TaxID=157072 RepID=A0A024U3Y1_9STRA|nr:hypothetical protein, variant 1 [Aphanomyces invadans]ETW00905.1 hypothetical protein, variant 1 [Aphanomyces invadans]|eukprot:XP_008869903.1 hypothetical protein, variant 1 [Aphanomyces invadans]